jgi:hypothetical protein
MRRGRHRWAGRRTRGALGADLIADCLTPENRTTLAKSTLWHYGGPPQAAAAGTYARGRSAWKAAMHPAKALFDHFIGASEQQARELQAELPCSFLVHYKLKFRWELNRQFGRIGTT